MKAKVKYNKDGMCLYCLCVEPSDELLEGESIVEVSSMDLNFHHKEPYRTIYKLYAIKEKIKHIISNYCYISGLNVGYQEDDKWKNWIESIIMFGEDYKDRVIDEQEIRFPADPKGDQEIITF